MAPFSKPETVLKQAEGLVSVGQAHAALQSLTEMFTLKRFRNTPLASLEPIMIRFVELCVEMRKGRTAKEGLMQYKNIAQNTNVASIEVVINKFVQLADAKVQEAQEKADKAERAEKAAGGLTDVDDLEAMETPESILLGAVSGDQSKDRTDRALVTPWLKFLWESYRTALETLKNNARLEVIYQQIAQQAFRFCLKHQRKVEFRRLCETLRLHLSNVAKYAHQPHAINLSDPDTLQHHLDTRFAQLNTSVELELWQEAFRSVEDVHNLLTMAKKAPRPAMMANYYEKLTKIFLMSGNALYHAAAWGKYYSVVTAIGGKSEEDMARLAGQVLVSTLAVPVGQTADEGDEQGRNKNSRLTSLLGLSKAPTRSGLLKDALARNVLGLSPPMVKSLYGVLEVTFDPLALPGSVAPLLHTLSEDASYASYLPLLQRALLSRLLSQLSQVYSTLKFESLFAMLAPLRDSGIPGVDQFDDGQVESYVMGCARRGELSIRVDHVTGSLMFVDDPFGSHDSAGSSSSVTARDSTVQPSTADIVRTRLVDLASCLHASLAVLYPPTKPSADAQQARFAALVKAAEAERKALQVRRALVARRRELASELAARKEKEAASRRAEVSRREKEAEERRAQEDARRKERERAMREIDNIRAEEAKKLAATLQAKGGLKVDINDMGTLNTDDLMKLQVQQLDKEKKDLSDRLRTTAKRMDHIERAFRKEERPLLAQDYEQQQATDRTTFDLVQASRLEGSRTAHQQDLETKKRLSRMMGDYKAHLSILEEKRGDEYMKRKDKAEKKIEEAKAKRRATVLKQREEERQKMEEQERIQREKEEEERRLEEERIAEEERQREEEERIAAEEEAKKREAEEKAAALRKQREAERAAAAEQARQQAQREEEAAERARQRALERSRPPPAATAAFSSRNQDTGTGTGTGGGNAWRKSTPANSGTAPPTPTRASQAQGQGPPPRSESPAPAAAPARYRPPGAASGPGGPGGPAGGGGGGGWREREAARRAEGAAGGAGPGPAPVRSAAPAAPPPAREREQPKADDDGFQQVPAKAVWRPSRGRGRGN